MEISLVPALFITFLVLKLTDVINWSWLWVTSPLWISAALWAVTVLLGLLGVGYVNSKFKK